MVMTEPDTSGLLSVQQAIRIIDSVPVSPKVIRVPLADAQGLRLAESLKTDRDYPPFDKSQMDGMAVRSADISTIPADLKIVGEVPAGKWPDSGIGPGEAMSIMTGAPLPPGADGVVPIEDVEKPDPQTARVVRAGSPQRFVARRGSDCAAGQVVLSQGMRLGPAQLAVAASIGAAEVSVFAAPRVAVLATGDELVPIGSEPGPSQIRNSNSLMLISLLRRLGCQVTDLGFIPDQAELIREALRRGLDHAALFVTGGMSMGEYDYVPRLLEELGVALKVTKLRIKPGKPFVFGIFGASDPGVQGSASAGPVSAPSLSRPASPSASPPVPASLVFGLPGNPVSAFVCTARLASRLLARMAGGPPEERWLTGRLDTGLPPNGPREFYQPALRVAAPGRDSTQGEFAAITPLNWKGSADLFTLAKANVLLVRPENDPPLPKGTVIRVLEF